MAAPDPSGQDGDRSVKSEEAVDAVRQMENIREDGESDCASIYVDSEYLEHRLSDSLDANGEDFSIETQSGEGDNNVFKVDTSKNVKDEICEEDGHENKNEEVYNGRQENRVAFGMQNEGVIDETCGEGGNEPENGEVYNEKHEDSIAFEMQNENVKVEIGEDGNESENGEVNERHDEGQNEDDEVCIPKLEDACKNIPLSPRNIPDQIYGEVENEHEDSVRGEAEDVNSIPSIYVDSQLLPSKISQDTEGNEKFSIYEINGTVFKDVESWTKDDEILYFEVKTKESNDLLGGKDEDGKTQKIDSKQNIDPDLHLSVHITPYGVLINSIVILETSAWHTMVGDDQGTTCIVCDTHLNLEDLLHKDTQEHIKNLNAYKPLNEFELNVIRKVNNVYHCGICNITFDAVNDHLESESHGDNMLASINRASDIVNRVDKNRNNYIRFPNVIRNIDRDINYNRIRNTDRDGNDSNRNRHNDVYTDDSFALSVTRTHARNTGNDTNPVEDSSGFESESLDGVYDESENSDNDDTNVISYADMAKKPKTYVAPQYVPVKLKDKEAKVRYDSWNMVTCLKNNTFYCMTCRQGGSIRYKSDHCVEASHIENLMKCSLVDDYPEHVVRKVNDKLYHCGHCNNLQMIHEMREHILAVHMKKTNTNLIENQITTLKTTPRSKLIDNTSDRNRNASPKPNSQEQATSMKNANTIIDTTATVSQAVLPDIRNTDNGNTVETRNISNQMNQRLNMADTIIIREFGQCFRVSVLGYYFIQKGNIHFYCLLCSVSFISVLNYITDVNHASVLGRIPFWGPTGGHLLRQTPFGFHCLICNTFVREPILHTYEPMHTFLLNKSLNFIPMQPQMQILPPASGPPIFYQNRPLDSIPTDRQATENKTNETQELPNSNELEIRNTDDRNSSQCDLNSNKAEDRNRDNETECVTEMVVTENVKDNEIFDEEQFVYVKIKNTYAKITLTSYNALVQIGTGFRYCFLCSVNVFDLSTHVQSEKHSSNLKNNKFLDKYEKHLLRQISSTYHCAICNVMIMRKFLPDHLSWAPHNEAECHKIVKNVRRNEVKAGVKEITCQTQKEILSKDKDTEWKVILNVSKPSAQQDIVKKKKIVKIDGVMLKMSWDAYHGVSRKKNEYKCVICQMSFKNYELAAHVESSQHTSVLDDSFMLEYAPNLIRKVNPSMVHCLTCNTDVANEQHWLNDHIISKRHVKQFKLSVDSDACDSSDILTLNSGKKK